MKDNLFTSGRQHVLEEGTSIENLKDKIIECLSEDEELKEWERKLLRQTLVTKDDESTKRVSDILDRLIDIGTIAGIGGKTEPAPGAPTASASTRRLTFALEKTSSVECIGLSIEGFQFNQNGNKWTTPSSFDDEEGPDGMSILFFEAAEDAPPCTQKYKIHTYDMDHTGSNEIASASFRVQIISGGIFSN